MNHTTSRPSGRPSWVEHARISRAPRTPEQRRKLAITVLAVSAFVVAAIVWLIVAFL